MNFGLSDDQRQIKDTARSLLARRRAFEDAPAGSHLELWAELRELGWPGIAIGGWSASGRRLATLAIDCSFQIEVNAGRAWRAPA